MLKILKKILLASVIGLLPTMGMAQELKLGVVNPSRLLEEAPQAKLALKKLEKEFATRDNKLLSEQKAIKKDEEKLARDSAIMSESARRKLERDIISKKRELRRAKLPVLAMQDPDCFIPSRNYWDFIANVAEREGIKDLGFLVGKRSGADAADPGLARDLVRSPTLHHAGAHFCEIASTVVS